MLVWNPETGRMEEVDLTGAGPLNVDGAGGTGGGSPAPGFAGTSDQAPGQVANSGPVLGLGDVGRAIAPMLGGFAPLVATAAPLVAEYKKGADERAAGDKARDEEEAKAAAATGNAAQQELVSAMEPAPATPAPPVPATRTTTQRTIAAPGEKPALEGVKKEAETIAGLEEKKGQIRSDAAGAEAAGLKEKAAAGEAKVAALGQAQQEEDAKVEKARTRFGAEYEKYSKMEIADFYAPASDSKGDKAMAIGRRIADAVAVGLSELGRALSGTGGNTALEIIRAKHQEHYAKERAKIEKQKGVVGMAREGIADAMAMKQERLNDLNTLEAARLAALADKIEAKAKEVGTPFALAEGQRMAASVRQDAHKMALETAQGLRTRRTTEPNQPSGGAGGMNNDRNIYGSGGQPIAQTATPQQATKANAAISAYRQMDSLMSQLEQSYATHGKMYNPLRDATGAQKNLVANLKIAYKNAAELGAITGPDMALIDDAIGGAWTGDQGVAKLRAARAAARTGHGAALDSFGLPGAKLVQSYSATGAQPSGKQGGLDEKFLNGAKLITQRNPRTGATRKAYQMPDGTIVPLPGQ